MTTVMHFDNFNVPAVSGMNRVPGLKPVRKIWEPNCSELLLVSHTRHRECPRVRDQINSVVCASPAVASLLMGLLKRTLLIQLYLVRQLHPSD